MISIREWMTLCLAGVCLSGVAFAQSTTGTGTGGGSAGGNSAAGTGSSTSGTDTGAANPTTPGTTPDGTAKPDSGTPGSATPGTAPGTPGRSVDPFLPTKPATKSGTANEPGASSSFGTPGASRDSTPAGTEPTPDTGPSGPSSAFGSGGEGSTQKTAPPSYTVPGFFGGPSTTYVGGQGRLARPQFRYKVTVAQGYDDNVLLTPDDPLRFPDQQVLVTPGTRDTVTFVPVVTTTYEQAFAGPIIYFRPVTTTTFMRVVTPGRAPVIRTIHAPDPQERVGSLVSRAGITLDAQRFSRRSLFTADLNAQVDHYFDRPGTRGSDDYSGSFSLSYLYNLTPRLQASAAANIAYISQPDFTRANTPDRLGSGDIVNGVGRLNLMYRLTPRLTATLSAGQNAVIYVSKGSTGPAVGRAQNGDTFETTFSAEMKYLWKPRYTLLAEFRHVLINYPDTPSLNAKTELLLLGGELRLSSRLNATVRLGNAIRIFDESGKSSSSPYGEALLSYRLAPTSLVQWNSRYGFEEPLSADSEVLTYRTSLSYIKNFTPRLSMSVGLTGVLTNNSAKSTGRDSTQQTLDSNITLEYHYTRQLTLNATFSFTKVVSSTRDLDYDRSRIFLGGEYEF